MTASAMILGLCAVTYAGMGFIIPLRGRAVTQVLLSVCCIVTAGWSLHGLMGGSTRVDGLADLVRACVWYGLLLFFYLDARLGSPRHALGFVVAGLAAGAAGAVGAANPWLDVGTLLPIGILARLTLAVAELLLIENLYLNLPEQARWHVALPAVALGGLACFDILLCADLVLFHHPSTVLGGARGVALLIVAPLLWVAAERGRRWKGRLRLSRDAVFHSATLVLSGSVLLALGAAGEAFRFISGDWGWLAEVSLAFAALMGVGVMLTSGSMRSRFQRLVVDHFFAERYDYRRQWLACIRTLAGEDEYGPAALPTRAVRTVASVVDSPAGALFLRDPDGAAYRWAGSWNMPATDALGAAHPIVEAVRDGTWVARLDGPEARGLREGPVAALGPVWLAVPLPGPAGRATGRGVTGSPAGLVLLAPPRASFELEQEVYDLLRTVGREVATYLAEQRATQTLLQTRQLHDYGKRFAFVAHDIKNVSSQLGLLLSNAEHHIANPEFQKDMIETVRSSVAKITNLLARLEQPVADQAPAALSPVPQLAALVATYGRVRRADVRLEDDGSTGTIAMGAEPFETAVTHLVNNAVEAAAGGTVVVRVRHETGQVVVEVVDTGPGMSAEFVRDRLFKPFETSKAGGSGIGAYQARELAREAGGDLVVETVPGRGTTMRLMLPRTDRPVYEGAAEGLAVDGGAVDGGAGEGGAGEGLEVAA